MSTLDLFLPLAKVDLDRRIVHGIATAEAPDRGGEICDYASTKPYFETWSAEAHSASGGKSLGAVRAMHGRVAAGKLTDIAFDDEGKRILVAAKIVDDDEWLKVTEGVYTGFSQGGRYVKRWPDPETGLTRFTAEPTEISLVDLPCLPDATFEVVKDGVVEKRAFARPAAMQALEEAPAAVEIAAEKEAPSPPADDPPAALQKAPAVPLEAGPATPTPAEALRKAASALSQAAHQLERAVEENTRLRKTLADVEPAVAAMQRRIAVIEAQPVPVRAALRALPRSADFSAEAPLGGVEAAIKRLSDLPERERALALVKVSLANPMTPRF
jgi:hypothetical protein